MDENTKIYLEIAKIAIPVFVTLALSAWAAAWFLVKQLIFKPLTNLGSEVKAIRVDLVNMELGVNKRLVAVETDVVALKAKVNQ